MAWVTQWLKLALCKGPNRVVVYVFTYCLLFLPLLRQLAVWIGADLVACPTWPYALWIQTATIHTRYSTDSTLSKAPSSYNSGAHSLRCSDYTHERSATLNSSKQEILWHITSRCYLRTAKQAAIQPPLLSNSLVTNGRYCAIAATVTFAPLGLLGDVFLHSPCLRVICKIVSCQWRVD
jgi:hypothetical protein